MYLPCITAVRPICAAKLRHQLRAGGLQFRVGLLADTLRVCVLRLVQRIAVWSVPRCAIERAGPALVLGGLPGVVLRPARDQNPANGLWRGNNRRSARSAGETGAEEFSART